MFSAYIVIHILIEDIHPEISREERSIFELCSIVHLSVFQLEGLRDLA
jgi:hypothetical protein